MPHPGDYHRARQLAEALSAVGKRFTRNAAELAYGLAGLLVVVCAEVGLDPIAVVAEQERNRPKGQPS